MIDCKDYVITHKPYAIDEDGMYKALCVGTYKHPGWLSDRSGDSISEYNDRINECTGLYWIWKNTQSDYVGLSHYRRCFYNDREPGDRSRLDADRVSEILLDRGYDIILSPHAWFRWRVYDNMSLALNPNLNEYAYQAFLHAIEKHQPDYVDAFRDVMQGHKMHVCNLFVTSREIMNEYCEWLFSFLLEATDNINVECCTVREKRIAGYYAEVMWTVWMRKQKYKVYELPHTIVFD